MIQLLMLMLTVISFAGTALAENEIDIEQIGSTNTATTMQNGDGNKILGAKLFGNEAVFDFGNPALQESVGGTNTLNITQNGNNNELGVLQKGFNNELNITQSNDNNKLEIYVDVSSGSNKSNSVTVDQTGGANAKITHTGSGSFCIGPSCP